MWRLSGRGVPLEHQADRTERVLFFGSANTISTTSRDLRKSIRGERKQGWSRNDNAHCRAVYWAQSFIFRACISVFCPRLFMLLSSRLLASASPPGNLAGFFLRLPVPLAGFINTTNSWDLPTGCFGALTSSAASLPQSLPSTNLISGRGSGATDA